MIFFSRIYAIGAALILLAPALQARTVTLTIEDCDLAATISAQGPRYSWMGIESQAHQFTVSSYGVYASDRCAILLRFKLDKIPADQRVARAELVIPVIGVGESNARMYVWKLNQLWGVGVSHLDRMARPQRIPWNQPGARGAGTDRALKPSAEMQLTSESGEISFNVTSDVDLWHSDAMKNYGWMICAETPGSTVRVGYPLQPNAWKLRITYER